MRLANLRHNAMLYKDVTQWLRRNTFVAFFFGPLCAAEAILVVLVIAKSESGQRGAALMGALVTLMAVYLLGVAVSAGADLFKEFRTHTFELFAMTGLKPESIVAGRLGAALVQVVLGLSGALPFAACGYLLGGVDFLSLVLFPLAFLLLAPPVFLLALAVAGSKSLLKSTRKTSPAGAVIGMAVLAVILLQVSVVGISALADSGALSSGGALRLALVPSWANLPWYALGGLFYLGVVLVLFYNACACVSATSDSRAAPMRFVLAGLAGLWLAGWWAAIPNASPTPVVVALAPVLFLVLTLGIKGVFTATKPPPSVRRRIASSRGIVRAIEGWFAPTTMGGARLAVVSAALGALFVAMLGLKLSLSGISAAELARQRFFHLGAGALQMPFFLAFPAAILALIPALRRNPHSLARLTVFWWLAAGAASLIPFLLRTEGLTANFGGRTVWFELGAMAVSPISSTCAGVVDRSQLFIYGPWIRAALGLVGAAALFAMARRFPEAISTAEKKTRSAAARRPGARVEVDDAASARVKKPRAARASSADRPAPASAPAARAVASMQRISNAFLYKSLTQWLRHKRFGFMYIVPMLISLAVVYLAAFAFGPSTTGGPVAFGILIAILFVFTVLSVSMQTQTAVEEMHNRTAELLGMAGLSQEKTVRGRWVALLAQFCIGFFAILPFIFTTYLFGGVDFRWIAIFTAIAFLSAPGLSMFSPVQQPIHDRGGSSLGPLGSGLFAIAVLVALGALVLAVNPQWFEKALGGATKSASVARPWRIAALLFFALLFYVESLAVSFYGLCDAQSLRSDWREAHVKSGLVVVTLTWLVGWLVVTAGLADGVVICLAVLPVAALVGFVGIAGLVQSRDGPPVAMAREGKAQGWAGRLMRQFPSGSGGSLRAMLTMALAASLCGSLMMLLDAVSGFGVASRPLAAAHAATAPLYMIFAVAFPAWYLRRHAFFRNGLSRVRDAITIWWLLGGFVGAVLYGVASQGLDEPENPAAIVAEVVALLASPLASIVSGLGLSPVAFLMPILRLALGLVGIVLARRVAADMPDWRSESALRARRRLERQAKAQTARNKRFSLLPAKKTATGDRPG